MIEHQHQVVGIAVAMRSLADGTDAGGPIAQPRMSVALGVRVIARGGRGSPARSASRAKWAAPARLHDLRASGSLQRGGDAAGTVAQNRLPDSNPAASPRNASEHGQPGQAGRVAISLRSVTAA